MQIHAGAVSPYQHRRIVQSGELRTSSPPDLTTASAAVIHVRRENGEELEWAATLEGAAAVVGGSLVTVVHDYQAGDVPDVGTVYCWIAITTPAGVFQTLGYRLNVVDPFTG